MCCRGKICAALVKGKLIDSMTLSTLKKSKFKELLNGEQVKGESKTRGGGMGREGKGDNVMMFWGNICVPEMVSLT